MKKSKYKYLIWVVFLIGWTFVSAQTEQVVASSGKELSGSNGQVSYTLGEPVITTLSSASNMVSQGYQQSRLSVTAINDIASPPYQVSVYPNPTTDQLTLYIQGLDQQAIIKVYDITGKLLFEATSTAEKSQLDFSHYAAGQYILRLIDKKGTPLSNQQIIKTH